MKLKITNWIRSKRIFSLFKRQEIKVLDKNVGATPGDIVDHQGRRYFRKLATTFEGGIICTAILDLFTFLIYAQPHLCKATLTTFAQAQAVQALQRTLLIENPRDELISIRLKKAKFFKRYLGICTEFTSGTISAEIFHDIIDKKLQSLKHGEIELKIVGLGEILAKSVIIGNIDCSNLNIVFIPDIAKGVTQATMIDVDLAFHDLHMPSIDRIIPVSPQNQILFDDLNSDIQAEFIHTINHFNLKSIPMMICNVFDRICDDLKIKRHDEEVKSQETALESLVSPYICSRLALLKQIYQSELTEDLWRSLPFAR